MVTANAVAVAVPQPQKLNSYSYLLTDLARAGIWTLLSSSLGAHSNRST